MVLVTTPVTNNHSPSFHEPAIGADSFMPTIVKQGLRKSIKAAEKRLGLPEIKGCEPDDDQWHMRARRVEMFGKEFENLHGDEVPGLKELVLAVIAHRIQDPEAPPSDARFWPADTIELYLFMSGFVADCRTRVLSRKKDLFLETVRRFPDVGGDAEDWEDGIREAAMGRYFALTKTDLLDLVGHKEAWIRELGMELMAKATS